jgi:phosphohistidine swiveling domain-containing protein
LAECHREAGQPGTTGAGVDIVSDRPIALLRLNRPDELNATPWATIAALEGELRPCSVRDQDVAFHRTVGRFSPDRGHGGRRAERTATVQTKGGGMAVVGTGLVVSGSECTGIGRQANEPEQVFALLRDPALEETILLVDSPSATALVPLLAKVKGIVCSGGGMTSHLAIVSREFGLPCLMAADVGEMAALDGETIRISKDGEIAVV